MGSSFDEWAEYADRKRKEQEGAETEKEEE